MSRFDRPAILAPTYVDHRAPLGLVRALGNSVAETFWICLHEDKKWAIVISTADSRYAFQAWELVGLAESWVGITLGPVDILLDIESCIRGDEAHPSVGQMFIQEGALYLKVRSDTYRRTFNIKVGDTAGPLGTGLSLNFPSWRLVKADNEGDEVVLFSSLPVNES